MVKYYNMLFIFYNSLFESVATRAADKVQFLIFLSINTLSASSPNSTLNIRHKEVNLGLKVLIIDFKLMKDSWRIYFQYRIQQAEIKKYQEVLLCNKVTRTENLQWISNNSWGSIRENNYKYVFL